jgi:hypothetical protein
MPDRLRDYQLARFAEEGFVVVPDLVPESTVGLLRVEATRVLDSRIAGLAANRTSDPRVTWWRLADGRPYVLKIKPVLDLASTAAAVADGPELRAVVDELLGARSVVMEDKLMYKQVINEVSVDWVDLPVLGEEVRKHTDAAYFAARGFPRVLSVAVCLDACTELTGGVRVWPGSHLRVIEPVMTERQGPVVPDEQAPDSAAVTLVAAAGTVLIWDANLVHASGPNLSDEPRRLLVLGYAPTEEAAPCRF